MLAHRILAERIPQPTVDQLVQQVTGSKGEGISGETDSRPGAEILNEAKKVAVIRHIGIKRTKLVSTPMSRAIEDAKPMEATQPAQ